MNNKKISFVAAISVVLLAATMPAQARNVKYTLSIAEAMGTSEVQGKLDGSVKFYFGPQKAPQVLQKLTTAVATTKANVVEWVDLPACNNAFAWALKELQDSAKAAGANAVVNIVSSYKKGAPFSSETEFECHAGTSSAGLTLKGDVVKTADK